MKISTDYMFRTLTIGEIDFLLTISIGRDMFSDFIITSLINEKLRKNEKEYNFCD